MMHILVTGGLGKIGRVVVQDLLGSGTASVVTVLDRASESINDCRVRLARGEITSPGDVLQAATGCQAIVHLAAVHKYGIAPDDTTLSTNVMGTYYVYEAARFLGIRRVVSTSTESVLGWDYATRPFAPIRLPIDETHPLRPQDAYSVSKVAAEVVARSFADRLGLDTVVLRPAWVLTPERSRSLRQEGGLHPTAFGTFSFVDVRDLAVAYRLALTRPLSGYHVLFIAAPDSTVQEPLASLLPRLMPEIGTMAQQLTGLRAAVSSAAAEALLGWRAVHSWRRE